MVAQSLQISGVVKDPHQAVIVGAKVTLTNPESASKLTALTDNQGIYAFHSLKPGTYRLEAQAKGFAKSVRQDIHVATEAITVDFALVVSSVVTQVDVKPRPDGSTEESGGTYVTDQSFGPLGIIPAKEIPFSTDSISQLLIADQQATSLYDIAHNDASVVTAAPANQIEEQISIRGFEIDWATGYHQDGLTLYFSSPVSPEIIERVDLYKGLEGFMYGFVTPGGVVNYITKKPLETPLIQYSQSYESSATATEALDVSERFGPKRQFGIRANLASENGNQPIEHQSVARDLEAISGNWKPNSHTTIWGDFNHAYKRLDGPQLQIYPDEYSTTPVLTMLKAPDLHKNYGEPWFFIEDQSRTEKAGVEWKNDKWNLHLNLGRSYDNSQIEGEFAANLEQDGSLNGTPTLTPHRPTTYNSLEGLATRQFKLWFTEHTISLGDTLSRFYEDYPFAYAYGSNTDSSLNDPTYVPNENLQTPATTRAFDYKIRHDNTFFNDSIRVGKHLRIVGGVARPTFHEFVAITSLFSSTTSGKKWAPQAGIILSLNSAINVYGSYVESYQPGAVIQDSNPKSLYPVTVFQPYISKQHEIGVKARVTHGLEATAAIFRITEPSELQQFTSTGQYYYTQNGMQRNQGLEFSLMGKPRHDVTLNASAMFLDARQSNNLPKGVGLRSAVNNTARLFGEYDIPNTRHLVLIAGLNYTGAMPIISGQLNNPAVTLLDVGARYGWQTYGHKTTARLYMSNAMDKDYWDAGALGNPRTVKLQLQYALTKE
jgi:iron complex outermembrane receptor protein